MVFKRVTVYTTHVGSFPLDYSVDNVLRILDDLKNIGIDYPPYPQLRDFTKMFLEILVETGSLTKYNNVFIATDRREMPKEFKVVEAEVAIEFYRENNLFKGLRAPVTGPFTLASKIFVDKAPRSRDLGSSILTNKGYTLEFLVDFVKEVVNYMARLGYGLIVIDEPILSVIVGRKRILYGYRVSDFVEAFDRIFKGIASSVWTGVHVCGRIPPLVKEILLETSSVKILDHEFKENPRNFEAYSMRELDRYDKYLAVGVVSNHDPCVESLDEVREFVLKARSVYGERLLFIKPDCGFGPLKGFLPSIEAYRVAIEKLYRIVVVCREVFKGDA